MPSSCEWRRINELLKDNYKVTDPCTVSNPRKYITTHHHTLTDFCLRILHACMIGANSSKSSTVSRSSSVSTTPTNGPNIPSPHNIMTNTSSPQTNTTVPIIRMWQYKHLYKDLYRASIGQILQGIRMLNQC